MPLALVCLVSHNHHVNIIKTAFRVDKCYYTIFYYGMS